MKLYEIDTAIAAWEPEIDENGEVLNISDLENLEMERSVKLENIALYYKNLTSDANEIKTEEKNLKERREAIERKAERLKDYLAYALNGEAMETPKCKVSWRKSTSVNVINEELIPRDLMTEKPPLRRIRRRSWLF